MNAYGIPCATNGKISSPERQSFGASNGSIDRDSAPLPYNPALDESGLALLLLLLLLLLLHQRYP